MGFLFQEVIIMKNFSIETVSLYFLLIVVLAACGIGTDSKQNNGSAANATGSVTGKVYVVNSTTPVAGVVVSSGAVSVTSAADGAYTLNNLPLGSATISASKSGYDGYSTTITVATGTNTRDIYMTNSIVTGSLEGYVKDTCNTPIGNASVKVGSLIDTTDSTGHYQLTVPQGSVHMIVSKASYTDVAVDIYLSTSNITFNVAMTEITPPTTP